MIKTLIAVMLLVVFIVLTGVIWNEIEKQSNKDLE